MDALALALAVGNGLADKFMRALSLGRRLDAFLVDDTPHGSEDAAVGLRRWHDCFDFCCLGCCVCGCGTERAGAVLADAWGCKGGDLRSTKHSFEREANGQLNAGPDEAEDIPG